MGDARTAYILWTAAEDEALEKLARDPHRWSGQQIAAMLHRQGFTLRSRAAVLGRLHRNKVPIKMRLPANQATARASRRKNSLVRRAFLAAMGGEPERHPNDYSLRKVKPKPAMPDTKITGKHIAPEPGALALRLEDLDNKMCHFPFGAAAPFKFCGLPTDGRQYCEKHLRLTHNVRH